MSGQDDKGGFRFVAIGGADDEELVIHAGAPGKPAGHAPAADAADGAPGPSASAEPEAKEPAGIPEGEGMLRDPRRDRLRRRAEDLERAEAGLHDPKAFPKMQAAVLVVLALALAAFVVYIVSIQG